MLKKLVDEVYPNPTTRPKILGPAGFFDQKWFEDFLRASGPHVVDGLTHHIYNLGAGTSHTIKKVQDPSFLSKNINDFVCVKCV